MSTFLLLGRTGDIIAVLPFLKAEADAGNKPTLVVSEEFASVLDGVSYVNVAPFDGGVHLIREAFEWAKERFPEVKSLQVTGSVKDVEEITYKPAGKARATATSFIKEMWSIAGHLKDWDNVWPLTFDQRSPDREAKLVDLVKPQKNPKGGRPRKERPFILVACHGTSSPFPYAGLLMEVLRLKFSGQFDVVELPQAERIYDLLALYERAHCLVATDSAPLHLARAVPTLPVIALTNDRPILWNGSPWLPQWAWCSRYHDWPERALEMLTAIETCREQRCLPFVHVWNQYEDARNQRSFTIERVPIFKGACGRDSGNVLKDSKRVPFLKDCLRMGLQRATDSEVVVLTRPDTRLDLDGVFPPQCHPFHLPSPCYACRMTRNGNGDTFSPITDLFSASKSWWKSHLAEIPDYLLGSDYTWSEGLRTLFQKHGAQDVTGVCYREAKA